MWSCCRLYIATTTKMAGQKTLTSFFKPLNNGGVKRTISEVLNGSDTLENEPPKQQVTKLVSNVELRNKTKAGNIVF